MRRAVVVGGSIAGMCAARVLADRFDRVTVVERDALPNGESAVAARKGVPQARHVHALLVRGRRELERVFPGFEETALAMGAVELDFGCDFVAMRPTGWEPRDPSGLMTIWASRDLLEAAVRAKLREHARVDVVEGSVTGLDVANDRVRGVTTTNGSLEAELVVDASGRGSKAFEWLRAVGRTPPDETVVDAHVGYASLWMRAPSKEKRAKWGGWKGLWVDGDPPHTARGGVLFPIEPSRGEGRCIVTVAGFARDYPPSDEKGFRAWLRTLRSPMIADATDDCEALSPVHTSRSMTNRMRHYDRWTTLPGFLAIGDAVCAFNPVYGQGMSTSSACAALLATTIEPRAFFRAQARFLAQPWAMATGADFLFAETIGKRPPGAKLFHPYLKAVIETALEDKTLRLQLGEVFNLIRPASALFDPRIGARALVATARRSLLPKNPIPTMPPF